jgi:hypothetical protein
VSRTGINTATRSVTGIEARWSPTYSGVSCAGHPSLSLAHSPKTQAAAEKEHFAACGKKDVDRSTSKTWVRTWRALGMTAELRALCHPVGGRAWLKSLSRSSGSS